MKTNTLFLFLLLVSIFPICLSAQENILIHNAWINEAPPNAHVNAGYFEIENHQQHAITLVQVSSEEYERIDIHRSVVSDGVAKMVLQKSVIIAANTALTFVPGDYHLMLHHPRKQFRAGQQIQLSLMFANGKEMTVMAEIRRLHGHHH